MFIKCCYFPYYYPTYYQNYAYSPYYSNCSEALCSQTPSGYVASYDEVQDKYEKWRVCENTIYPDRDCLLACNDDVDGIVTDCCVDQYCAYVKAKNSWIQQFKTIY
ncbi:hypothetical protein COL32_26625 [Bacillus pseudomycoides]|uniref:hypothetical protein n=1 Tax=Bacillus pseudomycoides TaxID=64104 RepID=UPI000BF6989C|nr:hypothetical protein [Bacillus pseudomycoides]PFX37935.1 hypothetical protein COL32_26625 [Bacillus pseudomycoides]